MSVFNQPESTVVFLTIRGTAGDLTFFFFQHNNYWSAHYLCETFHCLWRSVDCSHSSVWAQSEGFQWLVLDTTIPLTSWHSLCCSAAQVLKLPNIASAAGEYTHTPECVCVCGISYPVTVWHPSAVNYLQSHRLSHEAWVEFGHLAACKKKFLFVLRRWNINNFCYPWSETLRILGYSWEIMYYRHFSIECFSFNIKWSSVVKVYSVCTNSNTFIKRL